MAIEKSSSEMSQLVKGKFDELIKELSDIISNKWQALNNRGSDALTVISNNFLEIYSKEENETDRAYVQIDELINEINGKILPEFSSKVDQMQRINANLKSIFQMSKQDLYKCYEIGNLLSDFEADLKTLVKSYGEEFNLKKSLINEHLLKARRDEKELVALTAMWMHEPYLDDFLIAKMKAFFQLLIDANKK
jgi:hypothetical protein